jgi:F0F1-type ATP synthase membrane subunit b/b'
MRKAVVDDRALLAIVDEMRVRIPEEIREARRILREREQIPQSAQMEAEQIIQEAREQADQLIRDEEVVKEAEARAQQLIAEAEEQAEASREEMDVYALNMLRDLERRMQSHLSSIQRGVLALDQEVAEPLELEDDPSVE